MDVVDAIGIVTQVPQQAEFFGIQCCISMDAEHQKNQRECVRKCAEFNLAGDELIAASKFEQQESFCNGDTQCSQNCKRTAEIFPEFFNSPSTGRIRFDAQPQKIEAEPRWKESTIEHGRLPVDEIVKVQTDKPQRRKTVE